MSTLLPVDLVEPLVPIEPVVAADAIDAGDLVEPAIVVDDERLPELIVELERPAIGLVGEAPLASLLGPGLPGVLGAAIARPLVDLPPAALDALYAATRPPAPGLPPPRRVEHFVRLFTSVAPESVVAAAGGRVLRAYRRPTVAPAMPTLSQLAAADPLVTYQGYLNAPGLGPNSATPHASEWGVNLLGVMEKPGWTGQGARVFLLEHAYYLPPPTGSWLHRDLPALRSLWGRNILDPTAQAHGLADLGVLCAQAQNNEGIRGIANKATILPMCLTPPIKASVDVYHTLLRALFASREGDVVHLAWSTWIDVNNDGGTTWECPPEVDPLVFLLIHLASWLGVTVVQPAGNHAGNLDLFSPSSASFAGAFTQDSGSIIVGACSPATGRWIGPSSWGNRVGSFAWGSHVATLQKAIFGTPVDTYRSDYSGTSSASVIVTGCCAVLQAMHLAKTGAPLSPLDLRQILHQTGTPPVGGVQLASARMPNLKAAAMALGLMS